MAEALKPEDVMFEQLEFLVWGREKHGWECACEDCLRYNRVRAILMEPFGEKTEKPAKSHQKTKKAAG